MKDALDTLDAYIMYFNKLELKVGDDDMALVSAVDIVELLEDVRDMIGGLDIVPKPKMYLYCARCKRKINGNIQDHWKQYNHYENFNKGDYHEYSS